MKDDKYGQESLSPGSPCAVLGIEKKEVLVNEVPENLRLVKVWKTGFEDGGRRRLPHLERESCESVTGKEGR